MVPSGSDQLVEGAHQADGCHVIPRLAPGRLAPEKGEQQRLPRRLVVRSEDAVADSLAEGVALEGDAAAEAVR